MEDTFETKLALVTGGSRGIGRAIVMELVNRGADVVFCYLRRHDVAERTVRDVRSLGAYAEAFQVNVGDEDEVVSFFEELESSYGYLDILVNNAASGVNRSVFDLTSRYWDWTMNINARGAWLCAKHAAPLMKGRDGKIVNISSLGSTRVMPEYLAVGASKAAVEAITRYLAVELAPMGISVNGVSGALVETEALNAFSWSRRLIDDLRNRAPGGRPLEPADIARIVTFLCSNDADMIRGQTLIVDGGLSLLI